MSKQELEIKHLRRKLRLARSALSFAADYPANSNSEPDVMGEAVDRISQQAVSCLAAWACLDRQHRRKSAKHG